MKTMYPKAIEMARVLKGGTQIFFRPVRPTRLARPVRQYGFGVVLPVQKLSRPVRLAKLEVERPNRPRSE
jgi:hypothetical protein